MIILLSSNNINFTLVNSNFRLFFRETLWIKAPNWCNSLLKVEFFWCKKIFLWSECKKNWGVFLLEVKIEENFSWTIDKFHMYFYIWKIYPHFYFTAKHILREALIPIQGFLFLVGNPYSRIFFFWSDYSRLQANILSQFFFWSLNFE